jgi:hypothetical protein
MDGILLATFLHPDREVHCRWREEVKSIKETTQQAVLVSLKLASLMGRATPVASLSRLQMLEQMGQRAEAFNGRLQRCVFCTHLPCWLCVRTANP